MDSRPYVLQLSELDNHTAPLAGGKGANLSELITAGVPVPDGFVVTTWAYHRAIDAGDIEPQIAAAHDAPAFAELRDSIAAVPLDEPTANAILDAYRALGSPAVAVRSSGTAEDMADAAFAGQHDTYLNIVGDEAVLDAVRSCWASLWTDRAADYRAERGIASADVGIAVVIQKMVQSQAAGVMFTADPVSGRRDRVVIDASPGLGESVVSGLVTPDHYVAQKKSGKIVESAPGRREVVIRSVAGGGTVESVGEDCDEPVLGAATVRTLVGLGREIEAHFGSPQDTEWSLVDGKIHIVQARPITAMPHPIGRTSFPQKMLAGILAEIISKRPYPLDYSSWTIEMYNGVRRFASSMGVTFPMLEDMVVEHNGVIVRIEPRSPKPSVKTPFIAVRNILRGRRFPTASWEQDARLINFLGTVKALRRKDVASLTYSELNGALNEALKTLTPIMDMRYDYIPRAAATAGLFALTLRRMGLKHLFGLLLTGAVTKTEETNQQLERLADQVRSDSTLATIFSHEEVADIPEALAAAGTSGRDFLSAFEAFLDTYGHREICSIALASEPVWRDSPQTVLGIIKGMAAASKPEPTSTAAQGAYAELLEHPKLRNPRRREKVLNRLVAARRFTSFREDTHFYLTMPLPIVRRILLEYGVRLTAVGALDECNDVFHLNREELALSWPPSADDIARLRALVAERAETRARLHDNPMIDRRYFATATADPDAVVTGVPASAGRFTGPVRIVTGPGEFHTLCDGEVLVAPFTNPAWTPLFQRASAVIVDTGGSMSHAAIVAREYGIPAVLGTGDAVAKLSNGMPITVDGSTGSVVIADEVVAA